MTHILDEQLFSYSDRVKGKVVVITGGASGIGKEASLNFASRGAKVVIGDLNDVGAQEVVAEIEASGGIAASIKCNVVVWEDVVALFDLAISKYESVDIVVPNAGISEVGSFETVKFKDGKPLKPKMTTLDVNLIGVLYTVHLAQHYLRIDKQEGDLKAIVLIGSMASWVGIPAGEFYSLSKHAILGMMRALHKPLELSGIRVGVIHPFFAETNILATPVKIILAGVPMVPVPRIAGAIFYAATDPDWATNGSAWLLPDNGPVFLVPKEEFKMGVFKMIDERRNAIFAGAKGVKQFIAVFKDLVRHTRPVSTIAFAIIAGAVAWKNQEQLTALANYAATFWNL